MNSVAAVLLLAAVGLALVALAFAPPIHAADRDANPEIPDRLTRLGQPQVPRTPDG